MSRRGATAGDAIQFVETLLRRLKQRFPVDPLASPGMCVQASSSLSQ